MGIGLDIDWQVASRICPFTLRIVLVFGGFVDNLIVDDCDSVTREKRRTSGLT